MHPVPKEGYQFIINATQYEFDVDVCAPVGTVLFTMVISIRDPSIAHNTEVSLWGIISRFSVNGSKHDHNYANINGGDFEYDNNTMLYNIPVNITLFEAFNPNNDITKYHFSIQFVYRSDGIRFIDFSNVILYEKGKL